MLINDCIIANYDFPPWHEWRQIDLWTLEINDTFFVNLEYIRRLWLYYYTPQNKVLTMKDCF